MTNIRRASVIKAESSGSKPLIVTNRRDLRDVTQDAIAALEKANDPPRILNRGGALVRLNERRGIQVEPLNPDSLRSELAEVADWRNASNGVYVPVFPSPTVVRNVLAQPLWPFPTLERIVRAPVFTRSARLVTSPGFDSESGIYLDNEGFALADIPGNPTSADVTDAKRLIMDELLSDFPFVSDAEKAHAVALLLVPFIRDLIEGPVPIHVVESSTPGTGKGLLVHVCLLPTAGRQVPSMTEGRDEDENRKRLTSHLVGGPDFVFLDNVRRPVDSSAIASAITAEVWEDRLLQQTKMVRVPMRAVFVITGNNPTLSNEMARRSIRIRLDAGVDQPWRRRGFRHPLPKWAAEHRAELVGSALVLTNAWLSAGRPGWSGSGLGSFEEWSSIMGGIFEVVEIPEFLGNIDEFYAASDQETKTWSALVQAWWDKYAEASVGVSDLCDLAIGILDLGTGDERSIRTRFGRQLGQRRDRIVAGCRIEDAGTYQGAARYRLVKVRRS
jgi:putative DNA primase/helicase